jgi:hypothetical protein
VSNFRCPLCDRRFVNNLARRRHLVDSTACDAVEAILRLRLLLADRDEAVAVTRRQRDESRKAERDASSWREQLTRLACER